MANSFPVRKSSYKLLTQEALAFFVRNVFKHMSSNPAYQANAADITVLGDLSQQFQEAIEKAKDRSVSDVIRKKQIQKQVLVVMDRIYNWMLLQYQGDDMWIVNAGFPVSAPPARVTSNLDAPFNLRITNSGISGEIMVSFQLTADNRVKTNAVEYSADNGVTWHNGNYGTTRGIRVPNLPVRQDIIVRVRSLGTQSRTSAWSESMPVFVL
jgi:hypothetical protein